MKKLKVNGQENEFYLIDKYGNVYNREGHKLTQFITNNGYARVKLSRGLKRGMYLVHRLVAETYIENKHDYPIVHHKDGNRLNNTIQNLEWVNNSKNQKERFKKHKGTNRKRVAQIDLKNGEIIDIFDSLIDAEQKLKIARQNISKVCRGKRKQAGGFSWRYI